MRLLHGAAALLLSTAGPAVLAQAIYRCGDSYSQQPCAGAQVVDVAPAPSAADRAQAGANARRDAALASALERDRLHQERQAAAQPPFLPLPSSEPEFEPHKWPEKNATRKLDVFTASAPGSGKKKDKAGDKGSDRKKDKAGKAAAEPPPRTFQVGQPPKPPKPGANS